MPDTLDLRSLSPQQILNFAIPTKEYKEIMAIWPPLRINWDDHTSAVAKLRTQTELADDMDEPDPAVQETQVKFSARDGHQLPLRTFRSSSASSGDSKISPSRPGGPLIVLYHGGGWCMGSTTMVAGIARDLVKRKPDVVVVAPTYRLAPEHVWPRSAEDGWDALNYIREHPLEFGRVDLNQGFVIGGISAGASMSLVYAHMARDEKLEPRITGVWSACGSARLREGERLEEVYRERLLSRTQEDCVRNPVLSPEMQKLMRECVRADETSYMFNALVWKGGEGEGRGGYGHYAFPKVYQQLCGRDVSRDEGLILDDMLKREGVKTRLDLYKGLPHCFWIALQFVPEYKRWVKDTMDGFEWLLQE